MAEPSRLARWLHRSANRAGRQAERAKQAYRTARDAVYAGELPTDESGRARIVCRRYAERRAVRIDATGRPACYADGHPDCEGCVEDIRIGRIETWTPGE